MLWFDWACKYSAWNSTLWASPCTFHSVAFHLGIDGPHRQRGADAGLVIGPRQRLAVDVFAPVAQLAQQVGHDLHRPEFDGQVDFVAGNESPAGEILRFPGQMAHRLVARRGAGQRGHLELGIAQARVLEPGQLVVHQRLAQQVMIEARQPLRIGDEVVQPRLGP